MRRGPIAALAVLLSGLVAAPAAGDPIPTPQAIQTIAAACADSQAALLAGGSVTTGVARLVLTPDRFEVGGASVERVVAADSGTYGAIAASGLPSKARKRALRYLKRPAAQWWVNANKFESPAQGWSATFEQARGAASAIEDLCAHFLQAASADTVDRTGNTWTFTHASHDPVTIATTDDGRLVRLAETTIDYSVSDVAVPTGDISFRSWQKASQAASLNRTLRLLAVQVARDVNNGEPTVTAIEDVTDKVLPAERVVGIKARQLRKGTLLYARNPYTKAYHAWRVYLKNDRAVARRVAP